MNSCNYLHSGFGIATGVNCYPYPNHPLKGLGLDQEKLGILSYWNIKASRSEKRPSQIIEFPLYSDSRIAGEIRNIGYSYEVLNLVPHAKDSPLINE